MIMIAEEFVVRPQGVSFLGTIPGTISLPLDWLIGAAA
jgi:hypothetical protein